MSAADEAFEPFTKLREQISAALESLGVEFEDWSISERHHVAHLVLRIHPEAFKSKEQIDDDKKFEDIMKMEHELSQRQKVEDARGRAENLLKMSKDGIFEEGDADDAG